MNKLLLLLVGLVVLASTMPVQASINSAVDVNDDIWLDPGIRPSGFSGGPFNSKIYDDNRTAANSGLPDAPYHYGTKEGTWLIYGPATTFCAEVNDTIGSSAAYYNIYALTTVNSFSRSLTGYAAWVYDKWVANESDLWELGAYTAAMADSDQKSFQKAIWAGITSGTVTDVITTNDEYGAEYSGHYIGDASDPWTNYQGLGKDNDIDISYSQFVTENGLGGSGLTNIGTYVFVDVGTDGENQATMFIGSGGATIVPEPASVLVWSLLAAGSWLGLRVSRRRRIPVGRQSWVPENRTAILEIIERGARK